MVGAVRPLKVWVLGGTLALAPFTTAAFELTDPTLGPSADCFLDLTLRPIAGDRLSLNQTTLEVAPRATYQQSGHRYSDWIKSLVIRWQQEPDGPRVRVRSTEPQPADLTHLILIASHRYQPPLLHTLTLPPCAPLEAVVPESDRPADHPLTVHLEVRPLSVPTPSSSDLWTTATELQQWWDQSDLHWLPISGSLAGIAVLYLLLARLLHWGRRRSHHVDLTDLDSDQPVASALDLARAYIAMQEYAPARKLLDQIQRLGSPKERAEASALRQKIPHSH